MAKQVTDPAILAQLQGANPPTPSGGPRQVTDPAILARLQGSHGAPSAPAGIIPGWTPGTPPTPEQVQALQGQYGKTVSGQQPPASAAPPIGPDGKIDVLAALQRQTGTGPYAPPVAQPDLVNNPMAAPTAIGGVPVPGPVQQALNTFNATTAGGINASTGFMGKDIYATLAALPKAAIEAAQGHGFDYGKAWQEEKALADQTQSAQQKLNPSAYGTGEALGSVALMGKAGPAAPAALTAKQLIARSTAQGAGFGGVTAFGQSEGSALDRLKAAASGALWGAGLGAVTGSIGAGMGAAAPKPVTPTVDSLRAAGDAGYDAMRNSGVVMSQPAASNLADTLKKTASDLGFVTPSGKVAGYTALGHAINLAEDFGTQPITAPQLMTLRDRIADVAGSMDPKERFVGTQMLKQFDATTANLASSGGFTGGNISPTDAIQAWNSGRASLSTAHNAQTVQNLIDAAKSSGKPVGAALQDQFSKFVTPRGMTHWADDLPPGMRGYSPAEVDAIQAVANGTNVSNGARTISNLAPNSVSGLLFKGGAPAAIGNFLGGPPGAAAASLGSMGLGIVGRIISDLSASQQAEIARVLTLNGGKLPTTVPQTISAPAQKALGNLIVQAASNPGIKQSLLSMFAPQPSSATAN